MLHMGQQVPVHKPPPLSRRIRLPVRALPYPSIDTCLLHAAANARGATPKRRLLDSGESQAAEVDNG